MRSGVPARSPSPSWTPLALTLGLHLLLVLAWRWQTQSSPAALAPERLIEVIPLRPPARLQSAPPPAAPKAPAARLQESRPRMPAASRLPVAAEPQVLPRVLPQVSPPATSGTSETVEAAVREAPLTLEGEDMLAASKRRAGEIDRQLRKGKSGVPDEAETPWSRFRAGVAAAHVDRSLSVILEAYESPDGVVIYRTTQGGKQSCRMTGSVNFGPGRAGGGNAAGDVSCPKGVPWRRL